MSRRFPSRTYRTRAKESKPLSPSCLFTPHFGSNLRQSASAFYFSFPVTQSNTIVQFGCPRSLLLLFFGEFVNGIVRNKFLFKAICVCLFGPTPCFSRS